MWRNIFFLTKHIWYIIITCVPTWCLDFRSVPVNNILIYINARITSPIFLKLPSNFNYKMWANWVHIYAFDFHQYVWCVKSSPSGAGFRTQIKANISVPGIFLPHEAQCTFSKFCLGLAEVLGTQWRSNSVFSRDLERTD